MIQAAIARRYAKALFELQQPADIGPTKDTLRQLADAFGTAREFRALLLSPVFSREQKDAVVARLAAKAGCPPITARFLTHVIRHNRIAQIREISEAFSKLADQASNRKVVEVSVARPLAAAQQVELQAKLARVLGSEIELTVEVDPALIGGMEVRIASTVYDGTIRSQLERLRSTLAKA